MCYINLQLTMTLTLYVCRKLKYWHLTSGVN